MTRTLSPDELESVREQVALDAQKAALRQRTAQKPAPGQVKLYDAHHDALKFGDDPTLSVETTDKQIVFGALEPGVAIVRADHPLLPALLRRQPGIVVLEPGEEIGGSYLCDEEGCEDQQFPTKRALREHRRTHRAPTKKVSGD